MGVSDLSTYKLTDKCIKILSYFMDGEQTKQSDRIISEVDDAQNKRTVLGIKNLMKTKGIQDWIKSIKSKQRNGIINIKKKIHCNVFA